MANLGFHWRALTMLDLPAVETIAAEVHPDFFEDIAVLAERMRLYPDGAMLLEMAGRPAGYLLSHPYPHGVIPPLNTRLHGLSPIITDYYVHDLALLPPARGNGAARQAVRQIVTHARGRGFERIALVAVGDSAGFWQRAGFRTEEHKALADTLAGYSDTARYMVRALR